MCAPYLRETDPRPIMSRVPTAAAALALILPSAHAQAAFTGLGDLPGGDRDSKGYAVAVGGAAVVGESEVAGGRVAFRWTESGGMVSLGDFPGDPLESRANAISSDGTIVAGQGRSDNGIEAFRWTEAEGLKALGDLTGGFHFARALYMTPDGSVIVGESNSANGFEAFRWTEDTGMVGIGDLDGGFFMSQAYAISADGRVIAGQSNSANGAEAFRWTEDEGMVGLGDLPGGTYFSVVYAASEDGSVLAGWGQSPDGIEAFRWTEDEGMVGLGDLPGSFFHSVALAVSADGSVVVGHSEGDPVGFHAFVWTESDGMRDLKTLLETDYGLDLGTWRLNLVYDISDDGTALTGHGTNPSGQTEAWLVTGLTLGAVSTEAPPANGTLALTAAPNPAHASAQIGFTLAAPGSVALDVFDALGRRVAQVRRAMPAGWGTLEVGTAGWPAGTYLARVQTDVASGRLPFTVSR